MQKLLAAIVVGMFAISAGSVAFAADTPKKEEPKKESAKKEAPKKEAPKKEEPKK
jgi:pentapeptide MXKDX repeat protein